VVEEVLTREDKEAITKALKDAERLRKELQRAKRAGIDVTELENRLREAELALRNLHRVYVAGEGR
jgi:DNA-binding phage protein